MSALITTGSLFIYIRRYSDIFLERTYTYTARKITDLLEMLTGNSFSS